MGVFREDYITYNYNKLDQFYQRKIGHDNVDERFFLSERSLQTVTKFTPFTPLPRQHVHHSAEINGNNSNSFQNNRKPSFMRNLNYETVANNDFSLNSSLFDLVIIFDFLIFKFFEFFYIFFGIFLLFL